MDTRTVKRPDAALSTSTLPQRGPSDVSATAWALKYCDGSTETVRSPRGLDALAGRGRLLAALRPLLLAAPSCCCVIPLITNTRPDEYLAKSRQKLKLPG